MQHTSHSGDVLERSCDCVMSVCVPVHATSLMWKIFACHGELLIALLYWWKLTLRRFLGNCWTPVIIKNNFVSVFLENGSQARGQPTNIGGGGTLNANEVSDTSVAYEARGASWTQLGAWGGTHWVAPPPPPPSKTDRSSHRAPGRAKKYEGFINVFSSSPRSVRAILLCNIQSFQWPTIEKTWFKGV